MVFFFIIKFIDATLHYVLNDSLTGLSPATCVADRCKGVTYTLSYDTIGGTMKAYAFITGYQVDTTNFSPGTPIFGVGLENIVPSASSCTVDIYIFGKALLSSIIINYISF